MLTDPFVGPWSLAGPGPRRRRLGGEQACVPASEDGRLMVFNPLNPGKNSDPRVQIRSQKPSGASAWLGRARGLREAGRRRPFAGWHCA